MKTVKINGKTVTIDSKGIIQPTAAGTVNRETTKVCPPKPMTWRLF